MYGSVAPILSRNTDANSLALLPLHADAVTLIDLEYGGPNYLAFEIGDYFCEFSGTVHDCTPTACVCYRQCFLLCMLQLWLVMFVAYICVVAAYFCTSFTVCVLVSKSSEGL